MRIRASRRATRCCLPKATATRSCGSSTGASSGLPAPRLVDNHSSLSISSTNDAIPEGILAGVEKLIVVDIALDRDHDNPQLIFESLNSTGLDLSQADLIRNYVLMGLPPKEQAEIYTNSWYPLEQSFPAEHQDCSTASCATT